MIRTKAKPLPLVLEEVSGLDSRDEKISVLNQYRGKELEWVVRAMYTMDWSDLSIPQYKPSTFPYQNCYSNLKRSLNRLNAAYGLLEKNPKKAQKLVWMVLETVHRDEADLLCRILSGKKIPNVSKSIWKRVYPELFTWRTRLGHL